MVEVSGTAVPPGNSTAPKPTVDPSKTAGSVKAQQVPFKITPMQDRDRWLKMIVYGKHGAGKTELVGSAVDVPQMRDVIMIDAESGDLTLTDSTRINNPMKISHIQVTSFQQVAMIHQFLSAYCAARDRDDKAMMLKLYKQVTDDQTATEAPIYRTVIVDSLTEVEVYCQYQVLKIDPSEFGKMFGLENSAGDAIDVAGWPEFRKNNEMVKLLVRAFRDLPMHVLFTCAEGYTQDEQKKHHYSPALTGKLASQVQGFVDIVGWMTVGGSDGTSEAPRRMYIQPITGGPKFDAKNRRSIYKPPFFENPSMLSIMKDIGLISK